MAVDPQAQQILDLTAKAIANGAPPMWEMSPDEARAAYRKMNGMFGGPEDVHAVEDRTMQGPGGEIGLRIYRPGPGARPALVFYHGGGFVIGDLDTHDRENRQLANHAGVTVISVDYRLAPEHRFPAAADDAWAALTWVRENADALDVDASRLAVGGDSAGGNLAAITAIRARDENLPVECQVLIYPAVDISDGVDDRYPSRKENDGYVLSAELNHWFIESYVGAGGIPDDPRLAPIRAASHEGLAPALIITAEYDPLRDEGARYAEALDLAGVPTRLSLYPGQIHGFFNLSPLIDSGAAAVAEVADYLAEALGSQH